jgi:hypothetical protein
LEAGANSYQRIRETIGFDEEIHQIIEVIETESSFVAARAALPDD